MIGGLATVLLVVAVSAATRPLDAQSFEGAVNMRSIQVSLEALADRGFDVSEALFDVPLDEILALRGQLESRGEMTVSDAEVLIKGPLMRMDTSDEDGPGYATVDLEAGVTRIVRPEERMYIEVTQADLDQMSGLMGGLGDEPPEISETGQSRTINGMSASGYDVVSFDGVSRIWVSHDDAELVAAFRELAERMLAMSMGDAPDPSMMLAEYGMPVLVQTLDYDYYRVEETLSVDRRTVSADLFVPPSGMQRMTMQEMMGGAMPPAGGGAGGMPSGMPRGGGIGGGDAEASPGLAGLAGLLGGAMGAPVWIEYEVTGAVDASGREEDVVTCSDTDDGFQARSLGDMVIGLEADGSGGGQHQASVSVASFEGRFEGRGTVSIRTTGQDALGLTIYEVEFEGFDLESREDDGVTNVRGSLSCAGM